jgi:putative ATP-dependent endonuclease of OLD family
MRIKHVSWSNFRRLPDGSLTARNHIVLVGPNDTGKSSIVRALYMCLGMPHAQLTANITPRDFTDPTKPLLICVKLDTLQPDDRAAFPDEVTIGPPEVLEIHLEATLDSVDHDQKTVRRFFPDSGHPHAPTKEQLKIIGFAYVPAARSLYRELGGADGTVRSLLSTLDLGADRASLDATIADYRAVLDGSAVLKGFRANVANALSEALPSPIAPEDVRVVAEAEILDNPLAGVALTVRDGGHDVPIGEQSDGIRALSLLSLLAISHQSARIVALDEPETHLHPIGQRAVAQSFQDATTQRVIVTHSPCVVARMFPLDIVTFGIDKRARQLPEGAAIAGFDTLTRYWSYRLLEPLTARQIVLVEGQSDRILLERVAHLAGVHLDRRGVAIFELEGKDQFRFAHKLFGRPGFDLPLLGLLDEDARRSWAAEVGCQPADLERQGYAICKPDLEGEYVAALGVIRVREILRASPTIGEKVLLAGCGAHKVDAIVDNVLADFCRRHKVPTALAVAAALTPADAAVIPALAAIVQRLA